MESNYTTLRIHKPIKERVCLSPPLSLCKGPFLPSKVPLRYQKRPTSKHEEEGLSGTVNQGQVDIKEFLKTLDDFSEIRRLTKPLSCSDWQAFMSMGNQQGTKLKTSGRGNVESRSASPKSFKIQKRRRRVEGNLQHDIKMSPQVPSKARKVLTVQKPSSPTFGRRHFEEETLINSTPAARRKRAHRNEREARSALTQELMSAWREKLSDALSGPYSQKDPFILKNNSSITEDSPGADSDTDLSEYDNEMYSAFASHAGAKPAKTTTQKYEEPEADKSQTKFSQHSFDEIMKKAAAQRVMGKIEEVEGIIRRVRRTSVDWIKETFDGRDDRQFVSSQPLSLLKGMQNESVRSWLEDQDRESDEDKHPLVAELHTLSQSLSRSLQQALKMEAARTESDASVEVDQLFCEQSHKTGAPLNVPSHPYQVPPIPSPCSSTGLDVSPRTSSSMERLSPILFPLLNFSPVSPSVNDQQHTDISESHRVCTDSDEDTFSAFGAGGRIRNNNGANNDGRNTSEEWSQPNVRLEEDDLLSSDEALQRQEEIWQQEVEESLSRCRSLFHPSRPKHIDFLRLTAPDDDIADTPSPLPPDLMVSGVNS